MLRDTVKSVAKNVLGMLGYTAMRTSTLEAMQDQLAALQTTSCDDALSNRLARELNGTKAARLSLRSQLNSLRQNYDLTVGELAFYSALAQDALSAAGDPQSNGGMIGKASTAQIRAFLAAGTRDALEHAADLCHIASKYGTASSETMELSTAVKQAIHQFFFLPPSVFIQVTKSCNLRCIMCATHMWKQKTGLMDAECFHRVMDECQANGVRQVTFAGPQGEPLLHPQCIDFIEEAVARQFSVQLSTNGTVLTDASMERLARSGISLIQFSFSGYDARSYESTYRGANFDRTSQDLKTLKTLISQQGPRCGTRLVINGAHLREPDFARKTREFLQTLGIPHADVQLYPPGDWSGVYGDEPGREDKDIVVRKKRDLYRFRSCRRLRCMGVYHDGIATACGCMDVNGDLAIGDLKTQSIQAIRSGDRFKEIVYAFTERRIQHLPLCHGCDAPYELKFQPGGLCCS